MKKLKKKKKGTEHCVGKAEREWAQKLEYNLS